MGRRDFRLAAYRLNAGWREDSATQIAQDELRGAERMRPGPVVDVLMADGDVATIRVGLGRLSTAVPELAELDLNPVIAVPAADGVPARIACVDVKLRLAEAEVPSAGEAPGLSPS